MICESSVVTLATFSRRLSRAIAQLVARIVRDDEVVGSNPTSPTQVWRNTQIWRSASGFTQEYPHRPYQDASGIPSLQPVASHPNLGVLVHCAKFLYRKNLKLLL